MYPKKIGQEKFCLKKFRKKKDFAPEKFAKFKISTKIKMYPKKKLAKKNFCLKKFRKKMLCKKKFAIEIF